MPLHVVLLNEFFYPDDEGGTASATGILATYLQREKNIRMSVLTSRNSYRNRAAKYSRKETWNGVEIIRITSPNWSQKRVAIRFLGNLCLTFGQLSRLLTMTKPDLVLVTSAPVPQPIAAYCLLKLRRVPYVYLVYDLEPDRTVALGAQASGARSVAILRRWQRKWLHSAHRVISIGRCMRQLISDRYDIPLKKIDVLEVGAEIQEAVVELPTRFRQNHDLNGSFIALYSGNLGQYHDFDTILDCAEALQTEDPGIIFVIVGDGARKKEVVGSVARRQLSNVRFFDYVPKEELADLLASADVHLITLSEGMEGLCVPSKLYSCLASGRPVVAVVPEGSEVALTIAENECGTVIKVDDSACLTQTLLGYKSDHERRNAEGARAQDVLERRYSMKVVAERLSAQIFPN